MIELLKSIFSEKPNVLLLGFGNEGRSSYRFIRKHFPMLKIGIADSNSSIREDELIIDDLNLEFHMGDDYLKSLPNYEIIIKSPGVKIGEMVAEVKNKITSQTDLFLQNYASQVIGVSGTKGKSTTVSLIKHFLDADAKDSILIGNIGVPAFDMIQNIHDNTIIVYELSAHQLEYLHRSPHISLLLNIFPEHLDYFATLEEYSRAKRNIFRFQQDDDIVIVSEELSDKLVDIAQEIIPVSMGNSKYKTINSSLIGIHNLYNVECALLAVEKAGVDIDVVIRSLSQFKGLSHRLEYVGEYGGVRFINDSISTVPESAIAAVKALVDVDMLILGGFDRGLDYDDLTKFLKDSSVETLMFLGEAGRRIYNSMKLNSDKKLFLVENLEDVFDILSKNTDNIKVCLLSPAAASYDQFKNFEHRGDKFKSLAVDFGKLNQKSV